jgi:tetratricopeptide (TPR) repeat protein
MSDKKPVIFISYARKDEPDKPQRGEVQWRTYVQSYLAPAGLNGIVHIWVDEGIRGGDKWKKEIEAQLNTCDLFILLVSINSLASDVVVNFEIKTIQERQARGENVHIFPIVLEPFPKKAVPWLMELNLRPKAGKPLSEFSAKARKSEMAIIADEVVEIIVKVTAEKQLTERGAPEEPKTTQGLVQTPSGQVVIDITHLPETAYEHLVGREAELKRLDEAWADHNMNIVSLIAEGGAGKSALVNEWLMRLQADNYRGAEAVLGWSFYNQGTKERATSSDEFLSWVLDSLGMKLDTTSATAKGEAIAEAMMKRRVLLVLDGCEPLQHGLDKQHGELKDQGLRALLRRFAAIPPNVTHGLVVLTSRLQVKEIMRWKQSAAPVVDVEQLSDEAGAALLRDNGVWGTDMELRLAAREFGGHPLALGLLASLIKETQLGDVRRRDHIRAFFADAENVRHDHARRVMESYEKEWLNDQPILSAVMKMVGLFDRPATRGCMRALRSRPVLAGLTDQIVDLTDKQWLRAIGKLRDVRLIAPLDPSAPDNLDAHPLVREWFGERLKEMNQIAREAAHGRIYEYLRDTTNEGIAPTLEDLAPLYQAIPHGCQSGRFEEVLTEVYINRLCRLTPDGGTEFYTKRRLGAFGSDLTAISWFFDDPYEVPNAGISKEGQAWLFSEAGSTLSAQGRSAEALPAIKASMQMAVDEERWKSAAQSDLAQIELMAGNVAAAVAAGARSVLYADRSGDEFLITGQRATHGNVLLHAGEFAEATRLFGDAAERQKRYQPNLPLLYSVQGYFYCDLLLANGNAEEALRHGSIVRKWEGALASPSLLDRGTLRLWMGRAHLALAFSKLSLHQLVDARRDIRAATTCLNEAVDRLGAAGSSHFIPPAMLARATFRRSIGDWDGAGRDLDEVEEVAEPGPMKLFLCDLALERARLAFAKIEAFAPLNDFIDDAPPKPPPPNDVEAASLKEKAAKQLAVAADYIRTCGYHRRDEELAELEAVLRGERFADLPPRV